MMWQYCNDWICCPNFYWPHTMTEISFLYQFCSYNRNPPPVTGIYLPVYWILSWFVMSCTSICLHHSNKYHKIYFMGQDTIKTSLGKKKLKVCDLHQNFLWELHTSCLPREYPTLAITLWVHNAWNNINVLIFQPSTCGRCRPCSSIDHIYYNLQGYNLNVLICI